MGSLYDRLQAIRDRRAAAGGDAPSATEKLGVGRAAAGSASAVELPAPQHIPFADTLFDSSRERTGGEWYPVAPSVWERRLRFEIAAKAGLSRYFQTPYDGGCLYFDTETTGLSTGSGTHAFLVGWAQWDSPQAIVLTQCFMADPAAEPALLDRIETLWGVGRTPVDDNPADATRESTGTPAINSIRLASYNGASFDLPLLRSRWVMNGRLLPDLQHRDYLYPARRCFKRLLPACGLKDVESAVFGIGREGDIPGELIPAMYFEYLRCGNEEAFASLLGKVLEHHAQDLASLAYLGRLVDAIENGIASKSVEISVVDPEKAVPPWATANGSETGTGGGTNGRAELRRSLSGLARTQAQVRFSVTHTDSSISAEASDRGVVAGDARDPGHLVESLPIRLLGPQKVFPVEVDERAVYRMLSDAGRSPDAVPELILDNGSAALPALEFARERWQTGGKAEWGMRLVYELRRRAGGETELRKVLEALWARTRESRYARTLGKLYEQAFSDIEGLERLLAECREYNEQRALTGETDRDTEELSVILERRMSRVRARIGDFA